MRAIVVVDGTGVVVVNGVVAVVYEETIVRFKGEDDVTLETCARSDTVKVEIV